MECVVSIQKSQKLPSILSQHSVTKSDKTRLAYELSMGMDNETPEKDKFPFISNDHAINCSKRENIKLQPAKPLIPQCIGWESGRQPPVEDVKGRYWNSVRSATQKAISVALDRPAKVFIIEDTELNGMQECTLFVDLANGYDVVLIHNKLDILLATCTLETDCAIRQSLRNDGHPAAMEVLELAHIVQKGGPIFDWIKKNCTQKNNPVKLGHESPGITVDFGLHDHQIRRAMMISTQLGDNILPHGTKFIRTETYHTHREACHHQLSDEEKRVSLQARPRMSLSSKGKTGKLHMLPHLRLNSTPSRFDSVAISAAKFEGVCRASASDISTRFFNSLPGVCALKYVQDALKWAEGSMLDSGKKCPFEGSTDYLYAKGSISLQATKGWHDDANGPACLTCWQNFGLIDGDDVQLVIAINGCFIRINSGIGKFVHFMAWLPHCTRVKHDRKTALEQFRLHHTSYTKMGTEYSAYLIDEIRSRNLSLNVYETG